KYPLRKTKVTCPNEKKVVAMKRLSTVLPSELSGVTDVTTVDGVGLMLKRGWVLVRPSGTEPVIRITCEAPTDKDVEEILSQAQGIVEATLSDM
ncbi:MAG: phosphoglucosamine mutase, partial [Candidatus Thorarchaeota archaeon]